jgi:hypothetical protein
MALLSSLDGLDASVLAWRCAGDRCHKPSRPEAGFAGREAKTPGTRALR